jgi:hypothetical protein
MARPEHRGLLASNAFQMWISRPWIASQISGSPSFRGGSGTVPAQGVASRFFGRKKRPTPSGALNYYCVWQVINFIRHDKNNT